MRVLLIGGTGFIGPHVARQFIEQGHQVTVYHRGETEVVSDPAARHVHSPLAGMPVLSFPDELLAEQFATVVHMIPMGEADARAAVAAFRGRLERFVALSSGDVYRAYGRFTGIEPGEPEEGLLHEGSPLRSILYPYRKQAKSPADWVFHYEKILMEQEVMSDPALPAVVLRLPKVYGAGQNSDLATVYSARNHPQWRWTHGYVENVAAAIVLATMHPKAAGRIYNVGEDPTPTVAERPAGLPVSEIPANTNPDFNYAQDIAYDTRRIRAELGYKEPISYQEGIRRTLRRP
jgi:nucleoside-diphosphate-sugar epimerase